MKEGNEGKEEKEPGPSETEKEREDIKTKKEEVDEKLDKAIEEARRVEAKTEKLFFLSKLKKLSIVLGGSLLLTGFLLIVGVLLIVFDVIEVGVLVGAAPLADKYKLIFSLGLGVLGALDILGGLFLAGE